MNNDDLHDAMSVEPPTGTPRPDAVDIVLRGVAGAKRRRARVAVIASIGAVVILVAGITTTALTLSDQRSPVPGPAQMTTGTPSTTVPRSSVPRSSVTTGATPQVSPPAIPAAPSRTARATTAPATTAPATKGPAAPATTAPAATTGGKGAVATIPARNTTPTASRTSIEPTTSSSTSAATTSQTHTSTDAASSSATSTSSTRFPATAAYVQFRLPSDNIICYDGGNGGDAGAVTCWIAAATFVPAGGSACSNGYVVYQDSTMTKAAIGCLNTSPFSYGATLPVLQYGQTNVGARARCTASETAGITCMLTGSDHQASGFQLSRSKFTTIGATAPATSVTRSSATGTSKTGTSKTGTSVTASSVTASSVTRSSATR